nr:hypothetical protein [Tanacetum cinerariifolium]
MDPLDPYVEAVMQAPPSPDFVPGPKHPPLPVYVSEPEHLEYLVPDDDDVPLRCTNYPADGVDDDDDDDSSWDDTDDEKDEEEEESLYSDKDEEDHITYFI